MYGFSLGTAPATELTAQPRTIAPAKLILEAPFASVSKIQQDASGFNMPSSFFIDIVLDNAEEIKAVEQPFLWMHGTADDFVQIGHGEVVVKNYDGTYKVERRVSGGGHSTVPYFMGFQTYMELIHGFIQGTVQQ